MSPVRAGSRTHEPDLGDDGRCTICGREINQNGREIWPDEPDDPFEGLDGGDGFRARPKDKR